MTEEILNSQRKPEILQHSCPLQFFDRSAPTTPVYVGGLFSLLRTLSSDRHDRPSPALVLFLFDLDPRNLLLTPAPHDESSPPNASVSPLVLRLAPLAPQGQNQSHPSFITPLLCSTAEGKTSLTARKF